MYRTILPLLVFLFLKDLALAQNAGIAQLSYAKTALEAVVRQYGSSIPDTSRDYKEYYLPISKQYNRAKASYEKYRGSMKDCILASNSPKKIKACLSKLSLNIENNLDTLQGLLDSVYMDYYLKHPTSPNPTYTTRNTGTLTPDVITKIVDALLDAGIKIWDAIQKKNKQFKDDYLAQIQSKDYALSDFDVLVKDGAAKK